jgi:hypothetical protein
MRTKPRLLLVLVASLAVGAAVFFGTSGTARADYGAGAVYQVEISANPPGFGIWFWAELDPGNASGDYQEADCIHLGGGHIVNNQPVDAALHDSGSVTGWTRNSDGSLTMTGIKIIAGLETVGITVLPPTNGGMYGHSNGITLTYEGGAPAVPGLGPGVDLTLPAQAQIAP